MCALANVADSAQPGERGVNVFSATCQETIIVQRERQMGPKRKALILEDIKGAECTETFVF